MTQAGPAPDTELALEKYRKIAAKYDGQAKTGAQEVFRRRAVRRLGLRPGQVVLDVGCGTGASFPLLLDGVGAEGSVVGIDQSPEMLALARDRCEREGWSHVTLVCATAHQAELPTADAAFFFFTHDIMRSPAALANVLSAMRPGARIVTAGVKRPPLWAFPIAVARKIVSRRYVTTQEGMAAPWSHLAAAVPDLRVERAALGLLYIATGEGVTE